MPAWFARRSFIHLQRSKLRTNHHNHRSHQNFVGLPRYQRSMSKFDEIESKFGISAYASNHEGFAAVVKGRYSDFVVHEVDLNGNIARLDSVETPQLNNDAKVDESANTNDAKPDTASESNRKRKLDESVDTLISTGSSNISEKEVAAEEPKIDWDSRKEDLIKLIGESPAQAVISFLQQHDTDNARDETKDDDITKFYTLPVISDKQIRRSIHQLVKSSDFNSIARADNAEGRIRIWHKRFEADMPADTFGRGGGDRNKNNGKGGNRGSNSNNRTPWPQGRPDFLRFVMYKENLDTFTAAKDVVRYGRLNPKRGISYAGMKDKRGITTQFCSVYRIDKEQLLTVNRDEANGNNIGGNACGGGNTTSKGANAIKLGNFEYSSDEVKLGALTGNRFDVVLRNVDIGVDAADSSSRNELVQQKLETAGKALKDHGFINYFGMQRFGKFHDTHEVGIAILKGGFESAVDIIMREKPDEYQRIAEAREQWAKRFEGIDVTKDEGAAREAEMKCARVVQKNLGRFMNCEKSIVSSLSRKPRDYKRAFSSIAKNMRSMFLHAYQSYLWNKVASHRIESGGSTEVRVGDLVLIEDSSGKNGRGTSGLKGKAVKMVDEQDLNDSTFSITDVVLPLAGSRVTYPGGSAGDLFDELLKQDGISKDDFSKIGKVDREIALGGDYRKLICKPDDVSFEVKSYSDPLQPILQTDLMKVNGVDVTATTLISSDNNEKQNLSKAEGNQDDLFAMVVGFSLPPSSYATIALRELTKRPTSSEYQSKLELSGKCERNIE